MFGNNNNIELNKLRVGFTFKYNGIQWTITEVGEYSWRTGEMSVEYTIVDSQSRIAYLEVEVYRGEYEVYYSETVIIDETLLLDAIENNIIFYENKEFIFEESYEGSYKNLTIRSSRERLKNYIFYNKKEMITIEKWSDDSMEVFYGEEVKKKHIKNIKSI